MSLAPEVTVQSCERGEQALAHLRAHQTGLVRLDVMMPGMFGRATMTRMLADPALRHIPVIIMTAKAMPQEVARIPDGRDRRHRETL